MTKRVVITGLGAVTSLGNNKDDFWTAIREGRSGIGPIQGFDASDHRVKLASEVKINPDEYVPPAEARKMDRFTLLAVIAAAEVMRDSGLNPDNYDPSRSGVMVSSGIGGLITIAREHARGTEKGFDRISPYFIPMVIGNMAAGKIAIDCGFHGYSSSVVTACAGGTNAIGDSMRMIRHGYADIMLCGGSEAVVSPLALGGFTSMRALSENPNPDRASIPFDLERGGFVLGEGAGMVMLEEMEHAKRRGAKIYAEISGYGASSDAYHITAPDPSGQEGARAITLALEDAGLTARDIDYINAHGTGTPLNDKGETIAIKSVFTGRAKDIPVSSTKSMTGHLLGAAGGAEAVICAMAIAEGFIPPTINYLIPDPECDLDVVPGKGRKADLRHVVSNSFGFGGHNASLVFSAIG